MNNKRKMKKKKKKKKKIKFMFVSRIFHSHNIVAKANKHFPLQKEKYERHKIYLIFKIYIIHSCISFKQYFFACNLKLLEF
jgi:hypothetical protein